MIIFNDVTKKYVTQKKEKYVLRSTSFSLNTSRSLGILGVNGAGKSTFMRVLSGIESPTEGYIKRLVKVSWPIGFAGGFSASLSGEENTRFIARLYGEDVDKIVEYTYKFSELGDYFDMPVRTYSSGMKARLAFGVSMAINFDVYLIDEVTAVGDKKFQDKCRNAFTEKRKNASVIMVSHSINTLKSYCDDFALLKNGNLEFFNSFDEAYKAYEGK